MSIYYWYSTSSTDPTVGANWTKSDGTTGVAPASGDDVFIQPIGSATLANIGAADMSAVALHSLTISQAYLGAIGSASAYWKIGAATWTIGAAPGDGVVYAGPSRVCIDFGTGAFVGTVLASGSSLDPGAEPIRLLANNSASKLVVLGGRVGLASGHPGETAVVGEVDVSGSSAICDLGAGVTWANANVANGAILNVASGSSGTLSVGAGATAVTQGIGAIATINAGGAVTLNHRPASGNAVTTLNLYATGTADFSQNPTPVTVGTIYHHRGGILSANPANPTHLSITTHTLVNCGTLTAG